MPTSSLQSVDVIYTWVDSSRADYQAELKKYAHRTSDLNPERFRDDFDLLKYSIRSLEKFFPHFDRMFLLTARPQIPKWLATDHPKIRLVHHDEVTPAPDTLPTFNSNVIETLFHRIPDLSERFIYLNDDCLFGAPVSPEDFYDSRNRDRIFGTWLGERIRSRIFQDPFLSFGLLEHGPMPIRKALWKEMLSAAGPELKKLRSHRFRQSGELAPTQYYRWFCLNHYRSTVVPEPFWRYLPKSSFVKLDNSFEKTKRGLAKITRKQPKFYCLNDDLGDTPSAKVVELVKQFLEEHFPRPSSFENPLQANHGGIQD